MKLRLNNTTPPTGRAKPQLVIFLLSLSTACLDPSVPKLQYMPDMADAPTVKAQEDYLDPPPHSIARGALYYAATAEQSTQTANVPRDAARGQQLYATFCLVCHGAQGKGAGTITDDFPRPPDITQAVYQQRPDGFFFHRITFGTVTEIMPGYGHALDVEERWQIVYYLRVLQGIKNAQ